MAQIIKHRRGLIGGVKNLTARNGELIIASGSISDLSGPFVFIGSPNTVDEGVAGAFNSVSKLYTGTDAPTITAATYGSALDGTPYYASGNKSLYILNNSNVGNSKIDLTGNIEGNTISGVTINDLQSTNITASFVSGAFRGDATGLYNIPASGVTGLNLSKIYSGSVQVTTDSVTGEIHLDATNGIYATGSDVRIGGGNDSYMTLSAGGYAAVYSYQGGTDVTADGGGNLWLWSEGGGNTNIASYDGGITNINTDTNTGNVNIGNNSNSIYGYSNTTNFSASNYAQLESNNSYAFVESAGAHLQNDSNGIAGFTARPNSVAEITGSLSISGNTQINGNTSVTGALVVASGSATFDQGLVAQNSNMLLTSGSSLIVQNNGYVASDLIQGNTDQYNYLSLNGNGVYGQNGVELSSTGDISLWAEGGTVNVTGSLKVTGDIVFSGSINIGDYSGDTVNFNGEVSSSIIPQTGAAFDLGSSGQTWNNVWGETAHFNNISLNSIAFSGLTEGRTVFVGANGSLKDYSGYTFDSSSGYLSAPIINATNDGNGTNFLVGNDMWIGDINEADAMKFKGADNSNNAKVYLGDYSANNFLGTTSSDTTLSANNALNLKSENSSVYLESFDGSIYLNNDSGNNINLDGDTYVNNSSRMYVNNLWDNSDNSNYLQLFGWNTDDGYWWESGNGTDTTLLNSVNSANINILQRNSGNVNIDATQGSVNIHSANGMNVTGSLVVSDASGVFNSSLIVNNSDLTLDGGTNQHMNDGAHLYFDTCVDMYYDSGDGNFIFYNDCNNFQFRNNVSITGSINVSGGINTDNIYGATYDSNVLRLNGGSYNAPDVELASRGQISLFSEGSNSNFAINMTGSVHVTDNLDVSGSVYLGQIYNYNSNINGGAIYIDSSDYTEISHNDGDAFFGVDGGGIYGTSNVGVTTLTSNAGDTTINANNGYHVNINAAGLNLSGATSVTGAFTVSSGSMTSLGGDLYVSGNLQVLGSSTNVTIQSQTVDIGDNIIQVNAYSPFDRYAGLSAYDSGSSGASGSFLWDSTNDYWLIVNANSYTSKIIGTTASTGSTGTEISLTSGTFPIATASNTIGDSLLKFSGTTLSYNTNKFTIDSDSGDTYISGNLTIDGGGDDNGSKTSAVTFRNSDNIIGFVSTTETTNELDGILGYNTATGVLEFSTLIDGGTY
jgi:hypothetical protein